MGGVCFIRAAIALDHKRRSRSIGPWSTVQAALHRKTIDAHSYQVFSAVVSELAAADSVCCSYHHG